MNPMFSITGTVINIYESTKGVNKDTGEEYGGQHKVQILGDVPLANGEYRKDMVSLTAHSVEDFKSLENQLVSVPVGIMAQSKGSITYYIPKGAKPSVVDF